MIDPNEERAYRAGLDTSQGGDCMTPAEIEREDAEREAEIEHEQPFEAEEADRQAELDHDLPLGWHRSLYGRGLYYVCPTREERKS